MAAYCCIMGLSLMLALTAELLPVVTVVFYRHRRVGQTTTPVLWTQRHCPSLTPLPWLIQKLSHQWQNAALPTLRRNRTRISRQEAKPPQAVM